LALSRESQRDCINDVYGYSPFGVPLLELTFLIGPVLGESNEPIFLFWIRKGKAVD